MAKKRSPEYEEKFKSYLFSGDWERYTEITKNLNAVPSIDETREAFKQWEEQRTSPVPWKYSTKKGRSKLI